MSPPSGRWPGTAARVSVVVITRDRPQQLAGVLPRLLSLPQAPPVVVVDNASAPGSVRAVTDGLPAVEVVHAASNLGAAGRTLGVRRAHTDYVAFADDDSWWASDALDRAADLFDRQPRLGVVAARTVVEPGGRPDPVNACLAGSPLPPVPGVGPAVLGFLACGAVVRRSAYLQAGGFHPRFGVGSEERLLAIDLARRGWSCAYADEVVAHHAPDAAPRPGRRRTAIRNDLWTAWLRRRPRTAAGALLRSARASVRDPVERAALLEALAGAAWVLRERRAVDVGLERDLALLDG
jgi:GT2 family glycosyltransferase